LNDPSDHNRGRIAEELFKFREGDFNDATKRIIKERFDTSGHKTLILLTGLVDINYCYEKITPRLTQPARDVKEENGSRRTSSQRWRDMYVAARWGDKEWIKHLVGVVEDEKKTPLGISRRFMSLNYVLQPEMVEYIRTYLNSDVVVDHGNAGKIDFAWEASRQLIMMLKGFPRNEGILADAYIEYSRDEVMESGRRDMYIKTCREWMAQQKKWEFIR
jgi:hypothetical protein